MQEFVSLVFSSHYLLICSDLGSLSLLLGTALASSLLLSELIISTLQFSEPSKWSVIVMESSK